MANNGLRTQYPYGGEALSPLPTYDAFPSPTSNYPSPGIGQPAVSPSFYPMAYQISPRFGGSAFIPPPDVFVDGRKHFSQSNGNGNYAASPAFRRRMSEVNRDPVAMHLLVETAMTDSQRFDILTVEEVEAFKQEQKGLDSRLGTTRRKLESETKIRDAAQSLSRLNSKKDKGHARGMSSRGSNAVKDTSARAEEELAASNRKVDDLTKELLEIESRMRLIDMQLLMHTAAVLQMTHHGPRRRKQAQMGNDPRPDSPASIYTYENERNDGSGDDAFDERSFYRSPENLDSLMNALQTGKHHRTESIDRQNQSLTAMSKRLENLNERIRELIVQANPERNQQYSLPPLAPTGTAIDAASVDRQLDFLDQGLTNIGMEQADRGTTGKLDPETEERLEGINNQMYAMLSSSDDRVPPPPTAGGVQEQVAYLEESFYNVSQLHYSMNEQIDDLRSRSTGNDDVDRYETTLRSLWQTIQNGEEDARERKRERRRLLAEDPDNTEELSPDEDYNVNEQFSLIAFDSKIRYLFRRATSLKDKQAILLRQIKQQRELNSKSDAQKEEQFNRLNEQVLSARSEKKTMEGELERAMDLLRQTDSKKEEEVVLNNVAARNTGLEKELRETQDRATSLESKLANTEDRAASLESELVKTQDDARDRIAAIEAQLTEAHDDARAEAATIQAELAQSAAKIDEATAALRTATSAKDAAEARATETSNLLAAKEQELRAKEEEFSNLESEVVRLTTELTFAKAELDGAYGTRAERAAASGAPAKQELASLTAEISALQKLSEAASQSEQEARDSERNLKAELAGMATDYEALTRDAIQNERDRDALEAAVDRLRDEKESLEMELSDERVKWLGIRSPSVAATNGGNMPNMANAALASPGPQELGATSIRMLREDFRKMMRERTAEGLRALRVSLHSFIPIYPPSLTPTPLSQHPNIMLTRVRRTSRKSAANSKPSSASSARTPRPAGPLAASA